MARKRLTSLPEGLWSKLAELESCVRQLDLVRGVGWTLALAALCVGAGLLADMLFELPLALRIGLLWFAIAVTLLSAVWMIWRPWRRHLAVVDLAAVVERAHPELKESLVSCIELYDTTIPENERGSALMRELAAKQTLHNVAPLDFRDAVSAGPAHRMFVGGLLAWALLLAPLAALANYRLLVARFFAPWQNLDRVTSFWFDVERGDRVVVRGSDVTLTAHPRGEAIKKFPETVQLGWVDEQGESDARRIDFDAPTKLYSTTIPHVMQGFRYHLSGAGNRSRDYHIRVVEAPAITELKVEIQPPAYTGQPAKVLDGPVGEIAVLERSRLRWKLTFNKPLQAAEWQWQPTAQAARAPGVVAPGDQAKAAPLGAVAENNQPASRTIPFKLSADKLSASWEDVPAHGGAFRLIVRDEHGLTNASDALRELTILPDLPPTLQVSGGHDTLTAQASDSVPIEVAATDDVGVGALELHYEVDATRHGIIKCEARELGRSEVRHQFQLELSGLNLRNGEMVSYRVRATDERPVPGPNETWSDSRSIRIDAAAKPPGTEHLAADQAELQNSLKHLQADVAAHHEQTDTLQKQAELAAKDPANQAPEAARQSRQEVESAADQHEELQARLEKLAAAFDKHPLFANLTKQAQQLAREEFADAQSALDSAEQAEPAARAEQLQAAEEQLTQAEQKLAELERQFDKLAKLERDLLELNRLATNAEQLAERLNQLDKQQREPVPANETQQEQDSREQLKKAEENQLAVEQKELAQAAADLLKRQPELQAAARQNQSEQLAKLTRQAEQLAPPRQAPAEELPAAATKAAEKQDKPNADSGESSNPQEKETSESGARPSKEAGQAHAAVSQLQEALLQPSAGQSPLPDTQQKGSAPDGEKSGQPSDSTVKSEQSGPSAPRSPSPLQSAAKRLQQAAQALRQASADCQCQNPGSGNGIAGSKPGSQGQGQPGATGPAKNEQGQQGPGAPQQAAGGGQPNANADVDGNLDRLKKRLAGRKWGELPGTLQTEILQAAQKKPNSEYAELIRQYFKEIAKTQPPTTVPQVVK